MISTSFSLDFFVNKSVCTYGGVNVGINSNQTISQVLIDAATRGLPGDNIFICNESGMVYNESVLVNFSVNLFGTNLINPPNITNPGSDLFSVFNITVPNVNFTNLSINTSTSNGISIISTYGTNINNTNITSFNGIGVNISFAENVTLGAIYVNGTTSYAIYVNNSNSTYIKNSKINNITLAGITLEKSNNSWVENNTMRNISNSAAINVSGLTKNNTFANNSISNVSYGIYLGATAINSTIVNNTLSNGSYYAIAVYGGGEINITNNSIYDFNASNLGIGLYAVANSYKILFANNNVFNSSLYGIQIDQTTASIIENNTVVNSTNDGIRVSTETGGNNLLKNNTVHRFGNNGILISTSDNNLTNNWINGTSDSIGDGIVISGVNRNILLNNTITNISRRAIWFDGANRSAIINNTIYSADPGLYLNNDANNNNITNNTIYNTTYGAYLDTLSDVNNITNNLVRDNQIGIFLNSVFGRSGNVFIINNTLNNNTIFGINLTSSLNITLFNNVLSNSTIGLSVGVNSNNNNITNNTVYNSSQGFLFFNNNNNTVLNNTAANNTLLGFNFTSVFNSSIQNNTAINLTYGLVLSNSGNNSINRNTLYNLTRGISLQVSENNSITNNTVSNSTEYGYYLLSSSNNTISNNTAKNLSIYGFVIENSKEINLSYNNATNNSRAQYFLINSNATFTSNNYASNGSANSLDINLSNSTLSTRSVSALNNLTTEYLSITFEQATNASFKTIIRGDTGITINADEACDSGQCNIVTTNAYVVNISDVVSEPVISHLGIFVEASRIAGIDTSTLYMAKFSSFWTLSSPATLSADTLITSNNPITSHGYYAPSRYTPNPTRDSSSSSSSSSSSHDVTTEEPAEETHIEQVNQEIPPPVETKNDSSIPPVVLNITPQNFCGDGACEYFRGETITTCRKDCGYLCGNGVIDKGETCDGSDLASQTCKTQGYGGGTLYCSGCTSFSFNSCTPLVIQDCNIYSSSFGYIGQNQLVKILDKQNKACQDYSVKLVSPDGNFTNKTTNEYGIADFLLDQKGIYKIYLIDSKGYIIRASALESIEKKASLDECDITTDSDAVIGSYHKIHLSAGDKPCVGVLLSITTPKKDIDTQKTDEKGQAVIPLKSTGEYLVSLVSSDGKVIKSKNINVVSVTTETKKAKETKSILPNIESILVPSKQTSLSTISSSSINYGQIVFVIATFLFVVFGLKRVLDQKPKNKKYKFNN